MSHDDDASAFMLSIGTVLYLHTDWIKVGLFFLVLGGARMALSLARAVARG